MSSIKHPEFQAKLKELETDVDVFNLREQVMQLKALAELMIEEGHMANAQRAIVDVSKVVERLNNIENGRKYVISIENIGIMVSSLKDVIWRHVPDEETRRRIAQDIAVIQLSTGEGATASGLRDEEASAEG